jgi:hypothetical protein
MTTLTLTNTGIKVFGTKPKETIFLPDQPYAVRLNCQAGQIAISEDEYLGKEMEISIIACNRYYGNLGKTQNTEWLQIFFVPAPTCDILPANTVCVSYIKTRSLSQFTQLITRLIQDGEPAEGIFKVSFLSHTNTNGQPYKSVRFDWRSRQGKAETGQLEQIAQFMASRPILRDLNGTKEMMPFHDYISLPSA